MNAQIWFFRRLWESGRKRQKSRTHEAVAPLKRERTEDPQRTVKTRWSRAPEEAKARCWRTGDRWGAVDHSSALNPPQGQRLGATAPPPLTSPLVSTRRLGGAAKRRSHNALGRAAAAAVAAASATASGRRWRKEERRIWTSSGLTSRRCSKPRSGKGTPGEGKGLRWPRLPEVGGELGGSCGLVSFAGDRCGQVRRRPPRAAGFWPLRKCWSKDWTRDEGQSSWLVGTGWEPCGERRRRLA